MVIHIFLDEISKCSHSWLHNYLDKTKYEFCKISNIMFTRGFFNSLCALLYVYKMYTLSLNWNILPAYDKLRWFCQYIFFNCGIQSLASQITMNVNALVCVHMVYVWI